jgi:hypothetical protein
LHDEILGYHTSTAEDCHHLTWVQSSLNFEG